MVTNLNLIDFDFGVTYNKFRIYWMYVVIANSKFTSKHIHKKRVGQDGIVFKFYITPSETQPIIKVADIEAKKFKMYILLPGNSRI